MACMHAHELLSNGRLACSHRWFVRSKRKTNFTGRNGRILLADDGAKRDPSFHEHPLVAVESFESRRIRVRDDEPIGARPHLQRAPPRAREDFKSHLSSAVTVVERESTNTKHHAHRSRT